MKPNGKLLRSVLVANYPHIFRDGISICFGDEKTFRNLMLAIKENFPEMGYGKDLMDIPEDRELPDDVIFALGRYIGSLETKDPAANALVCAMYGEPDESIVGGLRETYRGNLPTLEDSEKNFYTNNSQASWDDAIRRISKEDDFNEPI